MTVSGTYVGRLAPSPTGLLHLGHAATFWTAFQRARAAGGTLLLRNEDLDPQRSRAEFAEAMLDDLAWLGLRWEEPVVVQSQRVPIYRAAAERLVGLGAAYACTCSRRDLAASTQAPHEETDDEPVYSGRCRAGAAAAASLRDGVNYRFRVPDGERIEFTDGNFGPQSYRSGCSEGADFGDFLIWRKDGLPSYQLACVVDDSAMGITEVVRGRDLLRSTARQILLQRALALPTPAYFHTHLLRDECGVRLAKRHDALSLRSLRQAGSSPEQVLGMFASGHDAEVSARIPTL